MLTNYLCPIMYFSNTSMVLYTINNYLRHCKRRLKEIFFIIIYIEFGLKITKLLFLLLELKHSFILCLYSQKLQELYIYYTIVLGPLYIGHKKTFSIQAKLTELHYKENHSNRLKNKTNQITYFLNHKQT